MSRMPTEDELQRHADTVNEIRRAGHSSEKTYGEVKKLRRDIAEYHQPTSKGARELEKFGIPGAIMKVLEYDSTYVGDITHATDIYHAQQLGMKLRQLEVELSGGSVSFDSGQFISSTGDLKFGKTELNPLELVRGVVRKVNEETFFRPSIQGHGTILLDSSFKFITLMKVEKPTKVVMEKGIYLASIGNFKFRVTKNLNPGYMVFSEKSIFQTDARGSGIIALELPVHRDELKIVQVTPETPLKVNGNYVLLYTGSLRRRVVPAGEILGSLTSGAGIVEEYSGTGVVWLAPTLGYYKNISGSLVGKGLEQTKRTDSIREEAHEGKKEPGFFKKLFLGQ